MDQRLQDFILSHQDDDTASLLLSAHKWPDVDVPLAVNCISARKKIRDKIPSWYSHPDIIYPGSLPAQQCSSDETARYKAALALRICGSGSRIADLTGGLGVDCCAFSRIASKVLYNEMNPELARAAQHNFKVLGVSNVSVSNNCLSSGSLESILGDFHPDMIFLDPARRSCDGRKVFMLEDCSPDILTLKDELLAACPHLLVKLSPMADISMLCRQLGACVREIHVVGSDGECKELLVSMHNGWNEPVRIISGSMDFTFEDEKSAVPVFGDIFACKYLYEPGKALLKSACFNLISSRFSLLKMAASTQLYLSDVPVPDQLASVGKVFEIQEILPFNKQNIKALATRYPGADITARNLPVSSDQLKARMRGKGGSSEQHIFAAATLQGNFFFVARRYSKTVSETFR